MCRFQSDLSRRASALILQAQAAVKATVTAADIARQLDEDRAFAREQGHSAAAVSATMGKGKILGYVVDRLAGPTGGPVQSDVRVTVIEESAVEILRRKIDEVRARLATQVAPRKDASAAH